MDERAAPRIAEPSGGSAAGETGALPAGVREESGAGAPRTLSAAATQATQATEGTEGTEAAQAASSSQSTPTHRDREREARALALAGLRLVPLLARVASVFIEGGSRWFGYADLGDFTREILGRSARWLRDLAELGAGLKRLAGNHVRPDEAQRRAAEDIHVGSRRAREVKVVLHTGTRHVHIAFKARIHPHL